TAWAAYSQTITASGGTGPSTLTGGIIQNAIAGLIVPTSGTNSLALTGTPTATGTETFTVTATDSLGVSTTNTFVVTINPAISVAGVPTWIEQGPRGEINGDSAVPLNDDVSGAIESIAVNPANPKQIIVGSVNGGVWM